jgi:pimeloyl-ACP methyl ester carboxylesterase
MRPTFVLVHGCGTTHRFWDELLLHLDLPVLAVTLPGRPPTLGDPLDSAAEAASWLREVIAHHRIHPIVVGHSFGGGIAIEYALLAPRELAGLVLACTGARLRVLQAILDLTAAAARTGDPADVSRWAFKEDTDPALVARVQACDRQVPPATTARDWQATHRFDRLGQLAPIAAPTLVVAGTADVLTPPRYAQYLADTIAHARLEIVADAGHMLPVEDAPALARLLTAFYSELSGAPPDAAT